MVQILPRLAGLLRFGAVLNQFARGTFQTFETETRHRLFEPLSDWVEPIQQVQMPHLAV